MWKRNGKKTVRIALFALLASACALYVVNTTLWGSKHRPFKITVVTKSTDPSIEFWPVLTDGVKEAAKEFEVEAEVTGARLESDIDGQIALLEEIIAKKPDAVVLAAGDYNRLVPAAEKIHKAGIRLITVDSGIQSDLPASFIATDNRKAGQEAGTHMAGLLTEPSQVAIISFVQGTATQLDRENGVRSVLEGRPGVELVGTFYSDGQVQTAFETALKVLQEHPGLQGLVGLNEVSTLGAGRAIRELGLAGKVKLVGFDSSLEEVKLLEEGVMQATVIQKPFQMGYLSIKTAYDVLRGRKVPGRIDTGSVIITKDNMYNEENQKLLFPFVDR